MSDCVKSPGALGFMTVVDDAEQGVIGGYLVLNSRGQPLEFHCTTPIKPNRAQEILYGPTLGNYLNGEQIGGALTAKSTSKVSLVCTDSEAVLSLTDVTKLPVVLIAANEAAEAQQASSGANANGRPAEPKSAMLRVDGAHRNLQRLHVFQFAGGTAALRHDRAGDESRVCEVLGPLSEAIALHEPFERIREAIAEAQRSAR